MKKKLLSLLMVAAMAVGMLAGCGSSSDDADDSSSEAGTQEEAEGTSDNTFTMAISYMPDSLRPSTASDDYTTMIRPIFDPLYLNTKDGIDYYLADSLDISDDGLTYTIHINEDANWSDGEPVTVQDILFTFDYSGLSSGGSSSYVSINGNPVEMNEIDEKTLEIVLPEPYVSYVKTLSCYVMPSHAFDNDPSKVDDSGYFNTTDMATSGAYVVSEINDDSIVYTARDDYYRGTPNVDKIVLQTIGSGSSKQVAFENGELSYMRITTAEELEKYSASDEYNMFSVSESRLNYLQVNPYGPNASVLANDDARKALFLALDGQEIVDAAYGSDELAVPANSLLTPDQVDYNPDCEGYTQDIETAKELAESSGLAGTTLTYVYNSDRANMEAIATVIQQQLAQIGVNLSIEGLDSTTFFQRFFAYMYGNGQENTWDLGTNGWDSERGTTGGQCTMYLKSDAWGFSQEVKDLAVQANGVIDPDESKELWSKIQDMALAEYWEYPLTYTNYVMVSQKNVTGLDGSSVVPEFADWLSIKVE